MAPKTDFGPTPYATEQGIFHVMQGTFLVEQGKFRSCVSAFTRLRRDN